MSWDEVLGQEFAKGILQNSLRMNRLHHAYIFYGPQGVGKGLMAKTLAKAINCEKAKGEGCGICSQCRLIEGGSHPDVLIIDPPGESFSIEEVRELKRTLYHKPIMGRMKIYILIGIERMGIPAANSLLIILEDPPSCVMFILTTTSPEVLPSTVVSRCQSIPFTPLPKSTMLSLLKRWGLREEDAREIAFLCEGIPSKAKMYIEGSLPKREVLSWVDKINEGGLFDLLELSKRVSSRNRGEIITMLDLLLYTFRERLEGGILLRAMEIVREAQTNLQNYLNPELSLRMMFLKLYRLRGRRYG